MVSRLGDATGEQRHSCLGLGNWSQNVYPYCFLPFSCPAGLGRHQGDSAHDGFLEVPLGLARPTNAMQPHPILKIEITLPQKDDEGGLRDAFKTRKAP